MNRNSIFALALVAVIVAVAGFALRSVDQSRNPAPASPGALVPAMTPADAATVLPAPQGSMLGDPSTPPPPAFDKPIQPVLRFDEKGQLVK